MTSSERSVALSPVKANDFERQWAAVGPSVSAAVNAVGESGWYILGPEVDAFERDFASLWGRRFAVGVASGLDAIEIGLRCLGVRPGDKVLVPPVSAFATVLAVMKLGAVPVFIDSDEYGLADLDQAERALSADASIRHFVPVHLYGHVIDPDRLAALRQRFGIRILEDCAQSIGSSFRGTPSGAAGECAATSFYPTKNLGAFGDGGAILTDSEDIARYARALRDYGQSSKYRHDLVGYNSRLDELHAAILRRALMPRLAEWTESRRRIARAYLDRIDNRWITVPGSPSGSDSCWHLFPVLVPAGRKADFIQHLKARSIAAGEHYPVALMDQPAMAAHPFHEAGSCAKARDLCAREVSLPIHPYLFDNELERVVDACNSWR